jgi:hypothetical protein
MAVRYFSQINKNQVSARIAWALIEEAATPICKKTTLFLQKRGEFRVLCASAFARDYSLESKQLRTSAFPQHQFTSSCVRSDRSVTVH